MDALTRAGHETFLVGGCVRDLLMGRFPCDWDVASSSKPSETAAAAERAGLRSVPTGEKHGTVTVISEGEPVEVTTFRTESGYSDGRHPDSVEFVSDVISDLARRDLTVNAMAYSPGEGLIDPFGGIEDMADGVLRCVGDPAARFSEDGLRILRTLRFSSCLGFDIHDETARAIHELKGLLRFISAERVSAELRKLMTGRDVERVMLDYPEVFGVIMPELLPMMGFDQRNPHHIHDIYTHSVKAAAFVPPREEARLAALLHDVGKPGCFSLDEEGKGHFYGHAEEGAVIAEALLRRLSFDNRSRERIVRLVSLHGYMPEADKKSVRRALINVGRDLFADWLAVKRGDVLAMAPEYIKDLALLDEIEGLAIEILAEEDCLSVRDLAVNGHDVMAMGIPEGPEVGRILDACMELVLSGEAANDREVLIGRIRDMTL